MKQRKRLSVLLTAVLTVAVTGCVEGGQPKHVDLQSNDYSETLQPKTETKVNAELLLEFGMTFAELECKYGKAVSGEAVGKDFEYVNAEGETKTFINHDYTYFFEKGARGYTFPVVDGEADKNRMLSGDIPVPAADLQYPSRYQKSGDLKVGDLLLNMKRAMTVSEFVKAFGGVNGYDTMKIPTDDPWITPYDAERFPYWTAFWYSAPEYDGMEFNISVEHAEEDVIEPDSYLKIVAQ